MESQDSGGLRDDLAIDRTLLAAERTFAAWIRTGLAALASGAGLHPLLGGALPDPLERCAATALIVCSVFCFGAGACRELLAEATWPTSDVARLPRAALLLASGLMIVVAVAVLAAVWMRR